MENLLKMLSRRICPLIATLVLLLGGCGRNPWEPTLEDGTDELTVPDGQTVTFTFPVTTPQETYGGFSVFVMFESSGTSKYISAVGVHEILPGEDENVAPTDPGAYSEELSLEFGSSYFLMTDTEPHYARIAVTGMTENSQERTVTITFYWVLRTEAGNPNLS